MFIFWVVGSQISLKKKVFNLILCDCDRVTSHNFSKCPEGRWVIFCLTKLSFSENNKIKIAPKKFQNLKFLIIYFYFYFLFFYFFKEKTWSHRKNQQLPIKQNLCHRSRKNIHHGSHFEKKNDLSNITSVEQKTAWSYKMLLESSKNHSHTLDTLVKN